MFNLTLKSDNELLSMLTPDTIFVVCMGCDEVIFPEIDGVAALRRMGVSRADLTVVDTFYVCNLDYFEVAMQSHKGQFASNGRILVFSCGAGVQQLTSYFADKEVFPACNTHLLPGFQGVTPSEFDCALCGDCHLNYTGAICPITSCAKSLLGGACGGAKNGFCEIDSETECGWERIYKRINIQN
ncbi:MAG: methylenetetrahydrofolate reductase C-terminal domain-containing protein [Oscillospiraceae bacterium]|nr:methylenetetrahydrofolate reductase C-terminal domain-containing protein [Oscillospiraceae bacterium]MCL2279052.1 methylenetetrahydrofolate reductase C-terminal domain-containing protein [Oscillospiraceae bacterium]